MALVQCVTCEATWVAPSSAVPEGVKKWDTFPCEGACKYCEDGPMVALLEE